MAEVLFESFGVREILKRFATVPIEEISRGEFKYSKLVKSVREPSAWLMTFYQAVRFLTLVSRLQTSSVLS